MSTHVSHHRSGDRLSERAARRAMAQFRTADANGAPDAAPGRRSDSDSPILRRWALADLIAAAHRRRAFA